MIILEKAVLLLAIVGLWRYDKRRWQMVLCDGVRVKR